jgi:hypothetical protein
MLLQMARKKHPAAKKKQTVRVPNPDAPVKERLKTPAHQRHRSKKDYSRRPKHRSDWGE